jgi:hypothetical protein
MFYQVDAAGGNDTEGGAHGLSMLSSKQTEDWIQRQFAGVAQPDGGIVYPIAPQLPHGVILIGLNGEATLEGLFDTGGACNMGEEAYFLAFAEQFPHLIHSIQKLADFQESDINIGGVGQGKVVITMIISIHLPYVVNGQRTRLVIGLGKNMPVTLLIGLPFFIASQCTLDIANQRCISNVFNTTWPLTFKIPFKKTVRELDQVAASGVGRLSLAACSDQEVIDIDEEPARKKKKTIRFSFPSSGGFEEEEAEE